MSSSGPSKPPGHRGHWLLPSTIRPEDIDGLANLSEATTHPPTSGCWGRARCECPFNPTDEIPEEWEERVFNCLWGQINEDTGLESGEDQDFSGQNVLPNSGLSSAVTYTEETHEDGEFYEEDSAVTQAEADGEEETYEQDSIAPQAEGEGNEEDWAFESDVYEEASDSNEEEEAEQGPVEPEAGNSDDEDQITEIADAFCRGNRERAAAFLKKQKRILKNRAGWSRSNSDTRSSGAGISIPPPKKVERRKESAFASKQPSIRKFQGSPRGTLSPLTASTTYESMAGSNKRKRTPELQEDLDGSHKRKKIPELEEDLDDDIYQPPSKKGKSKFGSFAQSPAERFGGANSGPAAKLPTKKARRTPAASQNTIETIPGSTWPKSEGDELYRLLRARRGLEKMHSITPLRDEKLFGLLSEQLQQVTRREKARTKNACKNFWNRYGRGYYDCDERGDTKRSNSKVTSAQSSTKVQKAKQQTQTKTKTHCKTQTNCKTEQRGQKQESDDEESESYEDDDEDEE